MKAEHHYKMITSHQQKQNFIFWIINYPIRAWSVTWSF